MGRFLQVRTFDILYIIIMSLFCIDILAEGFLMGFKSGGAHMFLLLRNSFIVLGVTVMYFSVLIVLRMKHKKWLQRPWTNMLPILAVILIPLTPWMASLGKRAAYQYAGLENIANDADPLMAEATEEISVLDPKQYPISFRRVGAIRVHYNNSSLTIKRSGLAGSKSGIVIYAKGIPGRRVESGGYEEKKLKNRIYEFRAY